MGSLARSIRSLCSRRGAWVALGLVLGVGLAPSARAAIWGSFDATRIAYSTGPLTGDAHGELRSIIEFHGDEVGDPTGELTAEYLAGVDVFYTAMLSDGTGPTAGSLGRLSSDEQAALQDWVSAGGTLIVTADTNGFDGPFGTVYESWTSDYGIVAYDWFSGMGPGMPNGTAHIITDGVESYLMDIPTSFAIGAQGQLLGTGLSGDQPFLVVFEPSTGFAEGGRMLVIADHNALTNMYIGELDNTRLAQNIVEWAEGECGNSIVESAEECDDGNTNGGDGCDASCLLEGGGSSGGSDSDTPGGEGDSAVDSTTSGEGSGSSGDSDPAFGESSDGCGCSSTPGPVGLGWVLLGLSLVGLRRRSSAGR